jgi:uncharacterized membrane protein
MSGRSWRRKEMSLPSLEENVKKSINDRKLTARNINLEFDRQLRFGERLSDRLADFAGSWTFIALSAVLFCIGIGMNSIVLLYRPFDPYPFIFLNVVLSALAALQAPVIIMSQHRQEARDRLQAEADYQVNLNTEMEIHQLHRKLDHLLMSPGQRLRKIQNIQVELMEETCPESIVVPPVSIPDRRPGHPLPFLSFPVIEKCRPSHAFLCIRFGL